MAFIFGLGFFKINQPWEISTFAYLQAHLNFFVSQNPVLLSITTYCIKDMQQSIIGKP